MKAPVRGVAAGNNKDTCKYTVNYSLPFALNVDHSAEVVDS